MLFERVGDVMILVHAEQNPSDSEWQSYVAALHYCVSSGSLIKGLLVTTQGGAPNAGQRKALLDAAVGTAVPTCVCTDSVIARGVLTAVSWVYPARMYALKLSEVDRALKLLNVPGAKHPQTLAAVARLQAELWGPV